jgi:bacillithiol system protein YtxJ
MNDWNNLNTEGALTDIIEASNERPQIIFKHSTRCGISSFAKERIEQGYDQIEGKAAFHYLDLLNYRDVSNFIADRLNVIHQSPQIIILKGGEVIHSVTHHSIQPEGIAKFL